jgi:hypothetical protein
MPSTRRTRRYSDPGALDAPGSERDDMTTPTPAGWYDDRHGAMRWWDGTQWTDHVQPAEDAPRDAAGADLGTGGTGAAPSGYPGATPTSAPGVAQPGPYAPVPGPPAADGGGPERPKSRLWILWVVLGGVALLFVIAAAILIPLLIGLFSSAAGGGASTADESAAVAVVEQYDDAWGDADCDDYLASTTQAWRDAYGYADCADFELQAEAFDDSTEDYDMTITSVRTLDEDTVEVSTSETYLATVDENGQQLATPEPAEDLFVYTVVRDAAGWAIDDIQ